MKTSFYYFIKMDEYIELLNEDGTPSGKRCLKSIAHLNGYFHASVHIWFYTKDGEILLQKRKHNKDTFPNLWDVSVAGHISFGETEQIAALREVNEEIGLTIFENDLEFIGNTQHKNKHHEKLIDVELHHIYIGELKKPISELKIQEEEVADLKLMPIDDFEIALKNDTSNYVPHGTKYYQKIISALKTKTN